MGTVRVQLHDDKEYAELHKAMAGQGFSTTIVAGDGVRYHLPRGLYYYAGNATAAQMADLARAAATAMGAPMAKIIATEGGSAWWHLDRA